MAKVSIDEIIDIVANGGSIKTGVDMYNRNGVLLLERDVLVSSVNTLMMLKKNGVRSIPFGLGKKNQGIWDGRGNAVEIGQPKQPPGQNSGQESPAGAFMASIEQRLLEIKELKAIASQKYDVAKQSIKNVLNTIRQTGGEFDYDEVESGVSELVAFLTVMDNPFSYLTKEIFTYDDYLYNHAVNVCAIGTAVLNRFNTHFSSLVTTHLTAGATSVINPLTNELVDIQGEYRCYHPEELRDIATGFFLHDIGKIMIPDSILNKVSRLSPGEFELVKQHSYELGASILEKNRLKNTFVANIVSYHHAELFKGEERCYPSTRPFSDIPLYVKMCKLADIYDAMTSKRCYKEAWNPIGVVTEIFRNYAGKDKMLQHVLYSFVKSIGIYPPGSILFLRNGQMAYVLETKGPIVIPFTDDQGNTLAEKPDPLDISQPEIDESLLPDNRKSIKTPLEVYELLPSYLRPETPD